jgi:hypothetical protein
MYPFPIVPITIPIVGSGPLPRTGIAVAGVAFVAIALVVIGLILLRAATVKVDPDARR